MMTFPIYNGFTALATANGTVAYQSNSFATNNAAMNRSSKSTCNAEKIDWKDMISKDGYELMDRPEIAYVFKKAEAIPKEYTEDKDEAQDALWEKRALAVYREMHAVIKDLMAKDGATKDERNRSQEVVLAVLGNVDYCEYMLANDVLNGKW